MGIARSTYYDQPTIAVSDTELVETMAEIAETFEAYGYRRMRAALRHRGLVVNHKKIRRLMREHDLQPKARRRFVATTHSDHDLPIFPNLANGMTIDGPKQLWVADLTYVAILAGFVYVAVITRCLVPPCRRLCDQPLDRHALGDGGAAGGNPMAAAAAGLCPSFRSRIAVRLGTVSSAPCWPWVGRFDEPARQSI
jgi:hypothetical protein